MKPALQKIDPPQSCGVVRGRYSDLAQNQIFIREMQSDIDDFGPYIQNQLEADLKEIQQTASPQYIFKSYVKFVRIEPRVSSGLDYLNFAQVSVFDDKGANISQGKQATSSSRYITTSGPEKAVNGQGEVYANMFASGSINGVLDPAPWWQVDLGNPSVISRIVVRNRNDAVQSRLANYDLLLLNQQREVVKRYPLTADQVQTFEVTLASSKRELVDRKLRELRDAEAKMQESMKCLNLEINQRQSLSSDIYTLQQTAKAKSEEAKTKDTHVEAAKDRAQLLENPYNETTVWESWFPMGRTLDQGSIPVLWFLSIVFLSISFGLFLQLMGVNLEIPGLDAVMKYFQSLIDYFKGGAPTITAPQSNIIAQLFPAKGKNGIV